MSTGKYTLPYPRRQLARHLIRGLGKGLIRLLIDLEINGIGKIPQDGPVILASNHVDILDVALVVAFPKRLVEIVGNGDIPFDPSFAWIPNLYGYIPVRRGSIDRNALNSAMDVLRQDGVMAIFPEGGVWDPGNMDPQLGTSVIAQKTQTVIIPMAVSGTKDAIAKALKFRRPKVKMRIGDPIAPLPSSQGYDKAALKTHAKQVLNAINSLLDEESRRMALSKSDYCLESAKIGCEEVKQGMSEAEQHVLARMLSMPVFMETYSLNLRLPTRPLEHPEEVWPAADWVKAVNAIYNHWTNFPGYYNYRLGIDATLAAGLAWQKLKSWVQRAQMEEKPFTLAIGHIRSYPDGTSEEIPLKFQVAKK